MNHFCFGTIYFNGKQQKCQIIDINILAQVFFVCKCEKSRDKTCGRETAPFLTRRRVNWPKWPRLVCVCGTGTVVDILGSILTYFCVFRYIFQGVGGGGVIIFLRIISDKKQYTKKANKAKI